MVDRKGLLPRFALIVFSAMSLLVLETSKALAATGYTPLQCLSPTLNAIARNDAKL